MDVRREALLRLDGGEVLRPVAGAAAEVLHPPREQPGQVDRVEGSSPVVVAARVDRGPGAGDDPPVGGQSEGDEHRGPVDLPVAAGQGASDGPLLLRHPGQVRGVLPATSRPGPPSPARRQSRRAPSSSGPSSWARRPGRPPFSASGSSSGASLPGTGAAGAGGPCPRTGGTPFRGWTCTGSGRGRCRRCPGRSPAAAGVGRTPRRARPTSGPSARRRAGSDPQPPLAPSTRRLRSLRLTARGREQPCRFAASDERVQSSRTPPGPGLAPDRHCAGWRRATSRRTADSHENGPAMQRLQGDRDRQVDGVRLVSVRCAVAASSSKACSRDHAASWRVRAGLPRRRCRLRHVSTCGKDASTGHRPNLGQARHPVHNASRT